MYKQKKKQKNSGITLIALVLTIIVLLILAGVALSLALGQNGLIFKARTSKQEQQIAQEKDRIITAYGASFTNDKGEFKVATFRDELGKQCIELDEKEPHKGIKVDSDKAPIKLNVITKYANYRMENGRIIGQELIVGQNNNTESTENTIPANVKVGDIIKYDPTKGVTDTSKLTYTSHKGTAKTGGNGYGTQTVTIDQTAKEWVVISTYNNQIKVMSKEPVQGVTGGLPVPEGRKLFTLKGGIGWLYAEEELHKACSIYGYGKGAISTNTTYKIGNKYSGEAQSRTLTGSGARNMTTEDIVKIMKGESYSDFTDDEKKEFDSNYMYHPRTEVLYPTISSVQESGESITKQRYENKYYNLYKEGKYDKDLVDDEEVKANKAKLKEHIYKNNVYWVSDRFVSPTNGSARFFVRVVSSGNVSGNLTFFFNEATASGVYHGPCFLRPVVYLDGNMIVKQSDGVLKVKD